MAASVGVAVAEHVARGVAGGFATFSHGARAAAARPARGDRVACHAPRETMDGAPLRAFVAPGTVADGTPEQRDPGAFRPWVRRVGREPVTPVAVRAPGGRAACVDPGRGWGMVSRRGPFPVPAAAIEEALRDG